MSEEVTNLDKIGSGNGLLPDGTKSLPLPHIDLPVLCNSEAHLRSILIRVAHLSSHAISYRILSDTQYVL